MEIAPVSSHLLLRRWTLDRGVITTLTTGSSFKTNGRVENAVGAVKREVRTLISAQLCPLESWLLALRHVGERRLRCQLQGVGWPAAPLLKFGTRAFALKKSIDASMARHSGGSSCLGTGSLYSIVSPQRITTCRVSQSVGISTRCGSTKFYS